MTWVNLAIWPMIRISAMFTIAPLFGSQSIPMRIRVSAALVISVALGPVLMPSSAPDIFAHGAVAHVFAELLIGISMGFFVQLAFASLYMAGEMVATTMGLSMAQVTDPVNGAQVPVLGQLFFMLGMLIFLALNGHLALLAMLVKSFQALPVAGEGLHTNDLMLLVRWGSEMFAAAVRVALPAVTALLAINVMLGVITRSSPQLNLFSFGLPITTCLGLAMIVIALPEIAPAMERMMDSAFQLFATVYLG